MTDAVATARRVLQLEGTAILAAAERIDDAVAGAVELLLGAAGRIIVSGIGKSGIVAQKIAATLTSTGTAATFVHPIESLHGDLGLVDRNSVAILLSKSGETDELFGLLGALVRLDVPVIAITGSRESTLGRAARFVLDAAVADEACPHDLAPTTSTTVALAWGDALAIALLERKGFGRDDFGALHPGGRIGRHLFLRVRDVMVVPTGGVGPDTPMSAVVVGLAHGRGIVVVEDGNRLAGVITAGDLTRLVERSPDYLHQRATDVMTRSPQVVHVADLAAAALGAMERAGIMAAPVLAPSGEVVGIVHLHDLLRSGAA